MKLSAIQVKFETSKYLALKRYAAKKEVSLEQELEETLNRLYRKLVPPDVREYIEEGDEIEIICDGADEVKALEAMVELVESGLDE